MAKWKIGAVMPACLLACTLLPARGQAQLALFGKKSAEDPPPAFSNGAPQKQPEFCPAPGSVPPGTPDFCPPPQGPPQTPFLPCEDEDRTAFNDYAPAESSLCAWVKAEYLNWFMRRANPSDILATTSTAPNISNNFGALGQPNTVVLLGDQEIWLGHLQGARITAGLGIGPLPLEVSGFFLDKNNTLFSGFSNGSPRSPVVARPVELAQTGAESAFLVGFPGVAAGTLTVRSTTNLWGIDPNLFLPLADTGVLTLDCFAGYRYLELRESLQILNTLSSSVAPLPFNGRFVGVGNSTAAFDQFSTDNRFNGGQIGARAGLTFGPVNFSVDGKIGLGCNSEVVNIAGESSVTTPISAFRGLTTVPGGILAVASNSGRTTRDQFAFVPELDVNLGVQIMRTVRIFAGYDILYWSRVVRPYSQINNVVDTRQVPTDLGFIPGFKGMFPAPPFNRTDFWAQGFSVGLLIGF
jgi:hypothetical protein